MHHLWSLIHFRSSWIEALSSQSKNPLDDLHDPDSQCIDWYQQEREKWIDLYKCMLTLSFQVHISYLCCYFDELFFMSWFNIFQFLWLVHVLIDVCVLRAHQLKFLDFLSSHFVDNSILVCIYKHIFFPLNLFFLLFLLNLLRLLTLFHLFELALFCLFFQTVKIIDNCSVLVLFGEMQWSFLQFVN